MKFLAQYTHPMSLGMTFSQEGPAHAVVAEMLHILQKPQCVEYGDDGSGHGRAMR